MYIFYKTSQSTPVVLVSTFVTKIFLHVWIILKSPTLTHHRPLLEWTGSRLLAPPGKW